MLRFCRRGTLQIEILNKSAGMGRKNGMDKGKQSVIELILKADEEWNHQNYEEYYNDIRLGLSYDPANSELYLMLGMYYSLKNPEQAYLCYKQALYYCDNEEDRHIIWGFLTDLVQAHRILIPKISIVILSFNQLELTKQCIESIRKNCNRESYELIVVDNASKENVRNWLKQQDDMKLILNSENNGFPKGCNQGIACAGKDNDILLLNNDIIMPQNALFWLQMGLYEAKDIGAAGSVSNNAVNYQQVSEHFATVEEWLEYAKAVNLPSHFAYEFKGWLMGFAMLIRRKALDEVGYLDEQFSPGNYEDNDLSIRLLTNGYKLLLCKNSFIFHYGGSSFKKNSSYMELLERNREKLAVKYQFDYVPFSVVDRNIIDCIKQTEEPVKVLEYGCKLGCTLARIKSIYPQSYVLGVEPREELYRLAKQVTNVIQADDKNIESKLKNQTFDYIILDNTIHLGEPETLLLHLKKLLHNDGKIIISFQNKQYVQDVEKAGDTIGMSLEEMVTLCNKLSISIFDVCYQKGKLPYEEESRESMLSSMKSFIMVLKNC